MLNLNKIKTTILRDCKQLGLKRLALLIIIIGWGSLLRTYRLNELGILFSDAGRDLIVASQALESKTVPLLGIPSSIPRFKQGPVSIWYAMGTMSVVNQNYLTLAISYSLLSILSLIFLYEFLANTVPKNFNLHWLSVLLLATSPLAVANARVPYHTTPIPLFTILFLWATYRFWQNKSFGLFWAVLAWGILFQFELATLPLILTIGYVFVRKKQKPTKNDFSQIVLGLGVGLLPQIIYDLTHKFSHLGGFGAWVVYRIGSFFLPQTSHSFELARLGQTFNQFVKFGGRILAVDNLAVSLILVSILIVGGFKIWRQFKANKLPKTLELASISTMLLLIGFIIHSSPSEAYFPPFFVLLPILIAYASTTFKPRVRTGLITTLVLISIINSWAIFKVNFFVDTNHKFNYGLSVHAQLETLIVVNEQTSGNYQLKTTREAGKFDSYFNNYDWLASVNNLPAQNPNGILVYVEDLDSSLLNYPDTKTLVLPNQALVFFE